MRALLIRVLVPVLALGGYVAAGVSPARAETLNDFAVQLGQLNQRVQLWLKLAERDPAADTIDRYKQQTEEDFTKKGHVEAKDLVAIVSGKDKDYVGLSSRYEVRGLATQALKDAATIDVDPDAKAPKRPGAKSPRGTFANQNLIGLITDKKSDRTTRQFVHEILLVWFGTGRGKNQTAILSFKADDQQTWSATAAAWKDIVRDL